MKKWFSEWASSIIMILVLVVVAISIVGIPRLFEPLPSNELQMGMVVVLAIGVLLILLYVMANGFSRLGLSDRQNALGLPEGSVRALIALFLIMIFIILSVYLFRTIASGTGVTVPNLTSDQVLELHDQVMQIEQNQDGTYNVTLRTGVSESGEQLGLQLATILGTLVTAVSAFYFGSTTVASAQRTTAVTTALSLDSITPASGPAATGKVKTELTGTGFATGAAVKLVQTGLSDIDATDVKIVDSSRITCTFDLTNKQIGQWDVMVVNSDGTVVRKTGAFQIT